jgi:hypothetical protein
MDETGSNSYYREFEYWINRFLENIPRKSSILPILGLEEELAFNEPETFWHQLC